jgi:hypothetical protein
VINEGALQAKAWWAPRVAPPKGAPNVLLIITDDGGFGVPSTFGGVIPTPTMDRVANQGLPQGVRLSEWIDPTRTSGRLQDKLDLHSLIGKLHLSRLCATQYASRQQCCEVRMYGLDVSPYSASSLAHSDGPSAAHGFEKFPALGCENLPQELRAGEGDSIRLLRFPSLPSLGKVCQGFLRGTNIKSYCLHG